MARVWTVVLFFCANKPISSIKEIGQQINDADCRYDVVAVHPVFAPVLVLATEAESMACVRHAAAAPGAEWRELIVQNQESPHAPSCAWSVFQCLSDCPVHRDKPATNLSIFLGYSHYLNSVFYPNIMFFIVVIRMNYWNLFYFQKNTKKNKYNLPNSKNWNKWILDTRWMDIFNKTKKSDEKDLTDQIQNFWMN